MTTIIVNSAYFDRDAAANQVVLVTDPLAEYFGYAMRSKIDTDRSIVKVWSNGPNPQLIDVVSLDKKESKTVLYDHGISCTGIYVDVIQGDVEGVIRWSREL